MSALAILAATEKRLGNAIETAWQLRVDLAVVTAERDAAVADVLTARAQYYAEAEEYEHSSFECDQLASAVTTAQAQVAVAQATSDEYLREVARLEMQSQASQGALTEVMAEHTLAMELLERIRKYERGVVWTSEIDATFAKMAAREWGGEVADEH